jgi:hypothetical protein
MSNWVAGWAKAAKTIFHVAIFHVAIFHVAIFVWPVPAFAHPV